MFFQDTKLFFMKKMSMNKQLTCNLCPKLCKISPGETGDCRIRYNHNGKLLALTYGRPAAVHIDPVEKKPLFHVLPGSKAFSIATTGCNLHCLNCQNAGLSQVSPLQRKAYKISPEKVVTTALKKSCQGIALTYTDPVVFYEYALDIGQKAKSRGLLNYWITAGYINRQPLLKAIPSIDAVNLDLKAFSDKFYRDICSATLKPVLETAKLFKQRGIWLELTFLIIPGKNDSEEKINQLTRWITKELGPEVPLHISRFFPHHKLRNLPATPVSTLLKARTIAKSNGIQFVYLGNLRGQGYQNTICPQCQTILIERYGYKVQSNRIAKGRCPGCNHKIPGIWAETDGS